MQGWGLGISLQGKSSSADMASSPSSPDLQAPPNCPLFGRRRS